MWMKPACMSPFGASYPFTRCGMIAEFEFVSRIFHAQRREYIFLNKLVVRLQCDLFDQLSQHIARIAVTHLLSRLEIQRLGAKSCHPFLGRRGERFLGLIVWKSGKAGDSGSVRQQMENRDLVPRGWRVRHIFLHRVIHLQLAAFFQQKD
jgi:hypothetical protein